MGGWGSGGHGGATSFSRPGCQNPICHWGERTVPVRLQTSRSSSLLSPYTCLRIASPVKNNNNQLEMPSSFPADQTIHRRGGLEEGHVAVGMSNIVFSCTEDYLCTFLTAQYSVLPTSFRPLFKTYNPRFSFLSLLQGV